MSIRSKLARQLRRLRQYHGVQLPTGYSSADLNRLLNKPPQGHSRADINRLINELPKKSSSPDDIDRLPKSYFTDLATLDRLIIRGIRQNADIHTPTIERRIIILRALGKLATTRKATRRIKPYRDDEMRVYAAVRSLQSSDAQLTQTRAYRFVIAKGLYSGSRRAFCKLLLKLNVRVHNQQ